MGSARIKRTSDKKRFHACISLLSRNKAESFLHCIVTCDKKYIFYDNLKHSTSWLDKDEAPKPNFH